MTRSTILNSALLSSKCLLERIFIVRLLRDWLHFQWSKCIPERCKSTNGLKNPFLG